MKKLISTIMCLALLVDALPDVVEIHRQAQLMEKV